MLPADAALNRYWKVVKLKKKKERERARDVSGYLLYSKTANGNIFLNEFF